jgi:hypothetical protein
MKVSHKYDVKGMMDDLIFPNGTPKEKKPL